MTTWVKLWKWLPFWLSHGGWLVHPWRTTVAAYDKILHYIVTYMQRQTRISGENNHFQEKDYINSCDFDCHTFGEGWHSVALVKLWLAWAVAYKLTLNFIHLQEWMWPYKLVSTCTPAYWQVFFTAPCILLHSKRASLSTVTNLGATAEYSPHSLVSLQDCPFME